MSSNWLALAESATMLATLMLLVIFITLHRRRPSDFSILWVVGWGIYVSRYVFGIFNAFYGPSVLLSIAYNEAAAISSIFLFRAALKTVSPVRFRVYGATILVLISAWIVYSAYFIQDIFWVSLPTFLFFGVVQIMTGYYFLRANRAARHIGGYIAGWGFIIWGIHKLDYPLLRPVTWFAPIGYLIGAILTILVGIGILMLLLEQSEEREKKLSAELEKRVEERTRELHEAQKRLMEKEKLALLGQLADGVGQELRNPLGVISNAVYFLKMSLSNANEKVREYLDLIEKHVNVSDKIVTDLLNFTQIKTAKPAGISLAEAIHQVLARFPTPKGMETNLDLPADLPKIYADPQHLNQILANLTLNACQSMEVKGGKLSIACRAEEGMIRVSVRDTGNGIPPENMAKIFEPLFTTKLKGIGLGLTIARKLLDANGGRIKAESDGLPGKGSVFTIWLPAYVETNG